MAEQLKIALCMPLYGGVPALTFIYFMNFLAKPKNYVLKMFFTESTEIAAARNQLVDDFLKSDCDYLFFLDSDMLIQPDIVDKLLSYDKDFISALSFTRARGFPAFRVKKDGKYIVPDKYERNSLFEADATGLACTLIKRKVIEGIAKNVGDKSFFEIKFKSRTEVIGEDVYFCELVKKTGYKIWVSSERIVGHFGGIIDEAYHFSRRSAQPNL